MTAPGVLNAETSGKLSAPAETRTRYLYRWLLVALFFEYARPGGVVPLIYALKLNSLIPLGLLVATIFAAGLRSPKEIMADPLAKWMAFYLLLIGVSVLYSEVSLYAIDRFKAAVGYFLLFWIICRTATTAARIRGVFLTLIFAHIFLLAMNPAVVLDPANRHYISGATFLGDGNDFALSLCILVPLAIELGLATTSKWRKVAYFGLATILLLAVIGTQSRGATLAIVAVAGYLWWRTPRKLLSFFVVAVVACGVALYASDAYFQRMGTISNYEDDGSARSRIEAWKGGLRMLADHPILGVGAGQFATQYGRNYRATPGRYMTAHSMYFLTLGELGTLGIVTLLMLVFGNIAANNRARKKLIANARGGPPEINRTLVLMNAGMLGFAVAGTFLSVSYYPHIFILTGLFVAARAIAASSEHTSLPAAPHLSKTEFQRTRESAYTRDRRRIQ